MDFIRKFFEYIISLLKGLAKNSPVPEVTREDVIKNNPELFAGTNWVDFTYIVIHHSLTEDRQVVDWNAIRRYHVKEKGWLDIGYHSGIEIVNGKLEIMVGRLLSRQGAHAYGFNDKAIGICIVGDFDIKKPDTKKLKIAAVLVKKYMKVFGIQVKNVIGHNEVFALLNWHRTKTCPGLRFDMDEFRSLL